MSKKILHLSGLNGLRTIAALAVVISHITVALTDFGLNSSLFGVSESGQPKSWKLAGFGVSIFFALSGFLITYLLIIEKSRQPINIPYFYLRRILRIWPLYYLYLVICIVAILLYGFEINQNSLLFYTFFAANIPFVLNAMLPFLGHYWSIGVEEQYYLIWPWIVKKADRYMIHATVLTIILLILLKLGFRYLLPEGDKAIPYVFIHTTRFHCMLIGALGAVIFHSNHILFIKLFTLKISQIIAWFVILLLILNQFHLASVLDNEFISFVTVVLIFGQITQKNRFINLEKGIFDFLGKISYGIYVIHPLVIFFFSRLLFPLAGNALWKYLIVYGGILGTTILLAFILYEYFEKRFLRRKTQYSVIYTSDVKASRKEIIGNVVS